ncbi:MAG: hypothetical protein EOO67_17035, partial [Microbacterium sp.]
MRLRPGLSAVLTCSFVLVGLGVVSPASAETAPGEPSAETQQILEDDHTAVLDDNGFLYYVDPAQKPPAGAAPAPQAQSFTTGQAGLPIPALNSRTSTHTIYLDFDGVTLPASSAWATAAQNPIAAGDYTGFTLDGSPDFSQAEIDYIQKVWRIVAEKYSMFDVNVTTVDPGIANLARTSNGDDAYGVQMVITNDASPVAQVCGGNCAGVAYIDLFDGRYQGTVYNSTNNTIGWVFSSKTFGSAQVTALDAAHEIGHTMGLEHDGGSANPNYYSGHANWVPIMGITNQNAVSQFSKGEYTGATNPQDDLLTIGANDLNATGSFLRADDYGDSASPTALGDQTSYVVDGTIRNAADDDVFTISRTC